MMLLSDIRDLLRCDVFAGNALLADVQIDCGCASDLMSDVLAFSRTGAVLLTGLANVQTIHTAFIAEISAIILVRGKRPNGAVTALANEKQIPLLGSPFSMYEACGLLYRTGLPSTMACQASDEHHG
jgi:hypothetical protein